MMWRDLLLRGRGADIGVRAPLWFVRVAGGTLGIAIFWLCEALKLWQIVGVSGWIAQLLLLVFGAIIAPSAVGAVLWLLSGALVTVLMLVSFTPIINPFVAPFVRADRASDQPIDAIVVFSGAIGDDGRIFGQALDRLLTALSVARQRRVPELALSIVSMEHGSVHTSSEADQRALVTMAAPELTVRFVRDVHSTRDEALAFSALARTHRWTRVLAITSPMHTRRACASLEQMGLAVECRPADARDFSLSHLEFGENRRLAFQEVLYETLGTWLYRARGWMR